MKDVKLVWMTGNKKKSRKILVTTHDRSMRRKITQFLFSLGNKVYSHLSVRYNAMTLSYARVRHFLKPLTFCARARHFLFSLLREYRVTNDFHALEYRNSASLLSHARESQVFIISNCSHWLTWFSRIACLFSRDSITKHNNLEKVITGPDVDAVHQGH